MAAGSASGVGDDLHQAHVARRIEEVRPEPAPPQGSGSTDAIDAIGRPLVLVVRITSGFRCGAIFFSSACLISRFSVTASITQSHPAEQAPDRRRSCRRVIRAASPRVEECGGLALLESFQRLGRDGGPRGPVAREGRAARPAGRRSRGARRCARPWFRRRARRLCGSEARPGGLSGDRFSSRFSDHLKLLRCANRSAAAGPPVPASASARIELRFPPAESGPFGSYQMQIQFRAPAMENAASFGSHGVIDPSAIPSCMNDAQPPVDLALVGTHFRERFAREIAFVEAHHAAAEVDGHDVRVRIDERFDLLEPVPQCAAISLRISSIIPVPSR